ncbi:hypothetical protein, partial [Klebsiella michiganensis]|uniref:hypothetical protein n=1 Tax=Klebsiella michiganensis TaxID=1134687 RepID=UPI001C871E06
RDGARPEDILRFIPRWRLSPYRGYGFTAVCDPVARTGAARRLRDGARPEDILRFIPRWRLSPYRGYG